MAPNVTIHVIYSWGRSVGSSELGSKLYRWSSTLWHVTNTLWHAFKFIGHPMNWAVSNGIVLIHRYDPVLITSDGFSLSVSSPAILEMIIELFWWEQETCLNKLSNELADSVGNFGNRLQMQKWDQVFGFVLWVLYVSLFSCSSTGIEQHMEIKVYGFDFIHESPAHEKFWNSKLNDGACTHDPASWSLSRIIINFRWVWNGLRVQAESDYQPLVPWIGALCYV